MSAWRYVYVCMYACRHVGRCACLSLSLSQTGIGIMHVCVYAYMQAGMGLCIYANVLYVFMPVNACTRDSA